MSSRSLRWAAFVLAVSAAATVPAVASGEEEVRAFWADAFAAGFKTRAQVDELVARVVEARANTIIAQVRRRGDSFYLDSHEPFTEDAGVEPGLDPLAYLLERAHGEGLEVHAWVAANTIFSGHPYIPTASWPCGVPCPSEPPEPEHVFNTHGFFVPGDDNWLTRTHPSFTAGTSRYPATGTALIPLGWRLADGNWWADPGHPDYAEYTVAVLKHLVSRYDIDGLHLDRIRYPEMPISRPFTGGPAGFSTGYNPVSVRRFNLAYGRAEGSLPFPWDADWSQWRRDQMDALTRRIYLETIAIKPGMKVSASTITFFRGPTTLGGFANTEAYSRVFQDWDGWMRQGILDLNVPMVYKPVSGPNPATNADNAAQFTDWTRFAITHQYSRQSAIGIGAYLNTFEDTLAQLAQTRETAATGEAGVGQAFYSYAQTNKLVTPPPPAPPTPQVPHRPHAEFFRALSVDGAYTPAAPYAQPATVPPMFWKTKPRLGYLLAQIVGEDGQPVDGADVVIQKMGRGPRDVAIAQTADGNGYVGATDLPPGAYQLAITTPEGSEFHTVPEPVRPGRVSRLIARLGSRPRGPMIRAEGAPSAPALADEEVSPVECWQAREPVAEDVAESDGRRRCE
jgi:uncharacterized lipoprotein YddW (UPF0748 family)